MCVCACVNELYVCMCMGVYVLECMRLSVCDVLVIVYMSVHVCV